MTQEYKREHTSKVWQCLISIVNLEVVRRNVDSIERAQTYQRKQEEKRRIPCTCNTFFVSSTYYSSCKKHGV